MAKPYAYGSIPTVVPEAAPLTASATIDHDEDAGFAGHVLSNIKHITHDSFVISSEDVMLHRFTGNASIPSHVANMTKNLIGGGVLSLSGGIAMYASTPMASLSVFLWIVVLGAVFGYFCLLYVQ